MQYSYSAMALVALFASVQAVTLPACAQTCITKAVAAVTTCGATDYKCICTAANQALVTTNATPCVLANCTPAEIQTTLADEPNVCPDLLASLTSAAPPATTAPPATSAAPAPVTTSAAPAPVTSSSAAVVSSASSAETSAAAGTTLSTAPGPVVTSAPAASGTVSGRPSNATSALTTAFTGAAATAGVGYLPAMLLGAAALAAL